MFQVLITVIGNVVLAIVCTLDRDLTFAEKVSLVWVAIFSVRVLLNDGKSVTESMHLRDFFPAVVFAALLSVVGALLAG